MWRSYPNKLQFNEEQNRHLAEAIERAGGEVLLDQRVRSAARTIRRLVILRHPDEPHRDVAFIGGIDLCHSRRDDASHRGDPQAVQMSSRYGERPPWHDVQLQVRGPVVGALDTTFRERWTARAPLDLFNPTGVARATGSQAQTRHVVRCRTSRPIRRSVDRTRCRCCGPMGTR